MKKFKNLLCFCLVISLLLGTNAIVFASEIDSLDTSKIYASYVPDLNKIDIDTIQYLPESKIDEYFESAFNVSSKSYTNEEKISAVKAISTVQNFKSFSLMGQLSSSSTTSPLSSYMGSKGVAWVRDTTSGGSPLTLTEAITGNYTLEVDFLTYKQAATIIAMGSDYAFFNSVKNAGSTAIASGLICTKLGISEMTIPSMLVSVVVSMGWDAVSSLDRSAMISQLNKMSISNMMRVNFTTSNNVVTKVYSVYKPSTTYNASSDVFTYFNIPNPYSGKYGNWHVGQIGYLYNY